MDSVHAAAFDCTLYVRSYPTFGFRLVKVKLYKL
jgi:hypothetical protein